MVLPLLIWWGINRVVAVTSSPLLHKEWQQSNRLLPFFTIYYSQSILYRNCFLLFLQNNARIYTMHFGNKFIFTENFNKITYLISKCFLIMIENSCFSTCHVNKA